MIFFKVFFYIRISFINYLPILVLFVVASVPSSDGRETPVFVSHQGYDESAAGPWGQYDPNVSPMPPYWGPEAWWGYYPPPPNLEGQQGQKMAQPPYWDPYSAMYAYMAEMNAAYGYPAMPYPPPVYSPHHFAPPRSFRYPHSGSDSDECSGYSSTDEMAYYGANFTRRFPPMNPMGKPQANSPMSSTPIPSATTERVVKESKDIPDADKQTEAKSKYSSDSSVSDNTTSAKDTDYSNSEQNSYSDEETSGSDTEVEDDQGNESGGNSSGGLQMIRSVSDINVYSNNIDVNSHSSDTNDEETEREDDSEEEEEEDPEEVIVYSEEQSCLPHQLSVIYEESEQSDAESVRQMQAEKFKDGQQSSDGDSSTATQENGDDESDVDYDTIDPASSTVTVRLPLKLKFSRSENDEEVTTLIVGDSQVKRTTSDLDSSTLNNIKHKGSEKQNIERYGGADKDTDVSVTVCLSPRPYPCNKIEQSRQGGDHQFSNKFNSLINKSPTPIGLAHQMSASDLDAYETAESDSDVSVCLSIPLITSRKNSPTPSVTSESLKNINLQNNEEDEDIKVKSEESDSTLSHWEDDSSSTSVQTVKLAVDKSKPTSKDIVPEIDGNVTSSEHKHNSHDTNEFQDDNGQKEDDFEDSTSEDESSSSSDSEDSSSRSYISSKEVDGSKKEDANGVGNTKTNLQDEKENTDDSSEESDDSDYEHNVTINEEKSACDVKQHTHKDESKFQQKISEKTSTAGSKISAPCIEIKSNQEKQGKGKVTLRRNSSKSQEESEEDDSGVTSDLSRPISDADTESETNQSELQLLTKCQRAATHSRLFKLLQDECGKSDDEDGADDEDQSEQDLSDSAGTLKSRKNQLTLPLNQNNSSDPDSLSSSSGFASPASPTITDRLVKELVKSLLQKKKGKKFKKLPIAKLQAAALRILQEDMDPYDTVSSAGSEDSNGFYLSPVHTQHSNGTENASTANNNTANSLIHPTQQPYGANYYDYCDYYDSWANAAAYYGADPSYEYDIVPSRAFKLLQEHAQPNGFSSGIINGLWGKCPRIPSSKNLHKDYPACGIGTEIKTAETCDPQPVPPPAPEDDHNPQAVTSAQAS